MVGKLVSCVVTGMLSFALTYFWRDFAPRLAVHGSLSVSILTYSTLQATERLRRMYKK